MLPRLPICLRHIPSIIAATLAVLLAASCAEEQQALPQRVKNLPTVGQKAPWARVTCTAGKLQADQLACVNGVAITRADYDQVVDTYPPTTKPAAIVRALVDAELLAQEAAKAKLWGKWLVPVHEKAMVTSYLQQKFIGEYTWEDVSQADLQRAWADWKIRIRYVSEPTYFATDAQFLCCSGDWRKCEIDESAQKCIDGLEDQARKLHAQLVADPPKSSLQMKGKVYALNHLFPKAAVTDVNFYYLKDVPHEDQIGRGYEVMVKPYATAVTALKPGQMSGPIRTPFGWHITLLNKVDPARKKSLRDPEVRRDIAENILPLVRRRDVQRHAFGLMQQRGVKINFNKAMKQG